MSRCDFEGTFYRVFCVGLLVVAFTFTVILTNVFIDIDSLLSKKEQEFEDNQAYLEHATENSFEDIPEIPGLHEYISDGERNNDDDGTYRTKRSLDSTDFLLHIQNPKMRNKLTNRLATLLEELDGEESTVSKKDKDEPKIDIDDIYVKFDKHKSKEVSKINEVKQETNQTKRRTSDVTESKDQNYKKQNKYDDSLHSAMHNVLVQGIKGHMDLNEVYKNLHAIVRNFKKEERNKQESREYHRRVNDQNVNLVTKGVSVQSTTPLNEESKFFEELTNCNKLQQDIQEENKEIKREGSRPSTVTVKSPKFIIRTFIDIEKLDKESNTNSKENMKGIVKLIYNGRSIKVKSMDDYDTTNKVNQVETTTSTTTTTTNINREVEEIADIVKENYNNKHLPHLDLKTMLHEYLEKYKKENYIPEVQTKHKEKRLKRNVKVNFEKEPDKKKKKKKDDDELFVEIETRFDKRGIKGQKKKEIVQKLVEKIQNALHSIHEEQKLPKRVLIKKRIQDPLGLKNDTYHNLLVKKYMEPRDPALYIHRELYPISKTVPVQEPLPKLADKNGQDWKQQDYGPKFFSTSKSINSAEIGEVNIDYAKLLHLNGIPQRLQLPLNTDLSDENTNAFFDLGNLQFLIKDLEGSGFSIGLNQYVDQAPDTESMKLFTGLENLVKTYHQNYDQNDVISENQGVAVFKHEMKKRDININTHDKKTIKNREVHDMDKTNTMFLKNDNDYHLNEYGTIFGNHFLPFDNYQQVYEGNQKEVLLTINGGDDEKVTPVKELPNDLNQLFDKKLKPSEILSLADLLERKKRSYNVKQITNLKTKIHLNRYINTNAMPKQRIILKNKRNKRQIDKIRIVTKDIQAHSDSNENIYIYSDENAYADRAVMRHTNIPNIEVDENKATEQLDEPIQFETSKPPLFDALEDKIRRNPLMSKYPHVFLDDMVDADYTDRTPTTFGKVLTKPTIRNPITEVQMSTDDDSTSEPMPKVQDLVNALVPYPKTSYKVTVKLLPTDLNETNSGFKEVHTSINKTFNKNGVLYSSMVNVSEISKIENNDNNINLSTARSDLRIKHDAITNMLKEHKERIDKQLNNLKMEKQKIDTMIQNKSHRVTLEKNNDLMDIILPSNPPTLLHLSKDDIGKLLISFMKEQDVKTTTEAAITTTTATTTTLKPVTTTTTIKPEVMDPMKIKLLRAITQNEQLTSQILNKIDQNTGILETYLGKITEKIQAIPDVTRQAIIDTQKKVSPHEIVNVKIPNSHPVYVRRPVNQTGVGIPFIYAYQQPNKQPNKTDTPVASIVYHEYHPNTAQKSVAKRTSSGDVSVFGNDDTRYFIDEDYFKAFLTPAGEIKPGAGNIKQNAEEVRSGKDKHKSPDKVQILTTQTYNPVELQQNMVAYNSAQIPSSNTVIADPFTFKSIPSQNITKTL